MHREISCRGKRGFTVQEMLLVVLLFAILAGLAIPGVVALQRSLHMKKLDEFARQIYVAAQNELTNMKASGRLEMLSAELERQGTKLTQAPSDYSDAEKSDAWSDLYYVSSASETGQNYLLLANDSLQQATERGGAFIVELNPLSGDVYSVFYAEESFVYDQVLALASREKKIRQKSLPQLGYYCGDSTDSGVGLPAKFEPTIQMINGEELAVKISCKNLKAIRRTQQNLSMSVYISDEHGNQMEFSYQGGTDLFVSDGSITLTKVLDSLEEKNQFHNVLPELVAGDNLKITVKMTYQDPGHSINIMGETTVDQVNSLFAQKTVDKNETILHVDHVRHLNNLRSSIYLADEAATIDQTDDISFRFSDWHAGEDFVSDWTENPLSDFMAITNNGLLAGGSFNGEKNAIKGFVFQEDDDGYAALFGSVKETNLSQIRLVDSASNGRNAATLVGLADNCTFSNCGAYLSTKNDMGAYYNDMATRRGQYAVTGTASAGGLIAVANNSTITACFGAVDVNGNACSGGLAGQVSNSIISQSYASGNVTAADVNTGGLVGQSTDGDIDHCYATGKVTAPSYAGGLVGVAYGGEVSDSNAYGRVTTDGETENTGSCGGFVGTSSTTNFTGCGFLQQASYNSSYGSGDGISSCSYTAMRGSVNDTDHIGLSKPYQSALRGQGFPFSLCQWNGEDMVHYGDWPEAYRLQTSLVYYERYSDGGYGYYAVTSLTSGDESAGDNWVVNTLKDEYCVEDGYALMTVYDLKSFSYTLDTAALSGNRISNGSVATVKQESEAGAKNSLLLLENAELKFSNQSSQSGQETTISSAKVYRLPFNLQITERTSASSFWESLTVTGYSSITGKVVFEDQKFYYCPDFAKNAVNSADGTAIKPEEPAGSDSPVYVRSPRQLNGLSRSTYYWNATKGGQRIQFIQEVDLDYGQYVTNYCGVTYNLMDTSTGNSYRNQPIGRPGSATGNNFQNSYDGQCKKIIDYCCEASAYQFTGLFGETEKCILKNIVMVASKPYQSAYVRSTFNNETNRPGTGALVGLAYVENANSKPNMSQQVWIENCSVSGYVVSYTTGKNGNYEFAIGGLVGVNFGTIHNCSAVCDIVLTTPKTTGYTSYIGGFSGSINGAGTIDNCYSGSSIVNTNQSKASIGGICGGFCNMFGLGYSYSNLRNMFVRNSYSYCTLENFSNSIALNGIAPVSSILTVNNCYYLSDIVDTTLNFSDTSRAINVAELKNMTFPLGSGAAASGTAAVSNSYPDSEYLLGKAYPFPAMVRQADGSYVHYGDWPEISAVPINGKLDLTQPTYLVYFEQYEDGSYGVYSLDASGRAIDNLTNDKTITKTGYGFLTNQPNFSVNVQSRVFSGTEVYTEVLSDAYQGDCQLVDISDALRKALTLTGEEKTRWIELKDANGDVVQELYVNCKYAMGVYDRSDPAEFKIRTAEQLQATSENSFTFILDRDIEATASLGEIIGSEGAVYNGNGYSIRGLTKTLFEINAGELNQLRLTEVMIQSDEDAAVLVRNNRGSIQNCYLSGSVISSGNAAGLAVNSMGTIKRCGVSVDVSGNNAAGVVYSATAGVLSQSYYSGTVSANQTAAGFCVDNQIALESCFASATVNGSKKYGLAPSENGTASNYSGYYTGSRWLSNGIGTAYYGLDWSNAITDDVPNEDWPSGIRYKTSSYGRWNSIRTTWADEPSNETNVASAIETEKSDGEGAAADASVSSRNSEE